MIRTSSAFVNGCQPCGFIGRPYSNTASAFGAVVAVWGGALDAANEPELIGVRADALEALRTESHRRWSRQVAATWRPFAAAAACVLVLLVGLFVLSCQPKTRRN